ncbi:MAG: nitrous oxide reductase family maturation protein NosD [Saprospiraceae bacterium]
MKSSNSFFFLFVLLVMASCAKENTINEVPSETEKVRPESIKLPNSSDYNIAIPNVPKYEGVIPDESLEDINAETRGETVEVDPGSNLLQDIINNADWGDKIVLKEGLHQMDETLVINRRIKLRGEEGAVLSLGGVLGMYIIDARKTSIEDLEINGTGDAVFGIAIEETNRFEMEDNHLSGFLISVLVEHSWKVEIKDNVIEGTDGDFVTGGFGITIMNGNKAKVYGNEVSYNSAGMWITDRDGKVKDNIAHDNAMGILLCKVPAGTFSDVFATGNGGSENACTNAKVEDNLAYDNVWGYVVIDGANNNRLKDNEGYNNSFVDLELAQPTTELFGEPTPGSWDNKVDAGDLYYIDCGEDNDIENGHLADVDCSI